MCAAIGPVKNELLSVDHETLVASSTLRGVGETQKHASDHGPVIFTFRDELHDVEYEASLFSITGTKMNDTQNHAFENGSVTNQVKSELNCTEDKNSCIGRTGRGDESRQNIADVTGSVTNEVKSDLHYSEYENSYIGITDRANEPKQNIVDVTGTELIRVKSELQDTNLETDHIGSPEEVNNVLENHAYENAVGERHNGKKQPCHAEVQTEMEVREIETQTILTCGDLSRFSDEDLKNEIQLRKLLGKRALNTSISHTESSPSKVLKRGPGRPRKDQIETPKLTTDVANTSSQHQGNKFSSKMQKRGPGRPKKDQSEVPKSVSPAANVAKTSRHQEKKLLPTEKLKRGPGRPKKDKVSKTMHHTADVAIIPLQQDKEVSSGSNITVKKFAHISGAAVAVPVLGVADEAVNKPQKELSVSTDADSGVESAVHKPEDTETVCNLTHRSDIPIIKRTIKKISIKEKKQIAEDAKLHGIRPTAAKYRIGKSTVVSWMKADFSSSVKRTKKGSLIGNSRPLTYSPQKEVMILSWILSMREQRQHVTMKMLQNYATSVIKEENPNFRGSRGWASLFFKRHGLLLRERRSQSQKLRKKEKTHREFPENEKQRMETGRPKEGQGQAPEISQPAEDAVNIPLQQDKERSSNSILTVTNVANTSSIDTLVHVPRVADKIDHNGSNKDFSASSALDPVSDEADDTADVKCVIQFSDIPVVRGKYRKMDLDEKFKIVEEAKLHGIRPTAAKYSLTPSTLGNWMKIDFSSTAMRTKDGSLLRSGRPLTYSPQKEVMILSWIHSMREQGQYVTLKMLQNYAASVIQDENPSFQGTTGWASWFLKRHGLALKDTKSKKKKPS
ncbi:hypothetical protein ACJMK2_018322 [Sinanodonta woodiana]|uniref:HTH CENPB-type domain-containing protein n=1 Tax=Sinanodonta woodiana TaxID=1069815 RepID=A0ABD3UD27_SINWO